MKNSNLTPLEKQYNDEVLLLDGLYEFHPDFFEQLREGDLKTIKEYYLTGEEVPANIFEYRAALLLRKSNIEKEAQEAYQRLLLIANIKKVAKS
ncbi:MAG TPA: hypothetical protein VF733_06075 [Candidatus Saccharimonadales bacterium]